MSPVSNRPSGASAMIAHRTPPRRPPLRTRNGRRWPRRTGAPRHVERRQESGDQGPGIQRLERRRCARNDSHAEARATQGPPLPLHATSVRLSGLRFVPRHSVPVIARRRLLQRTRLAALQDIIDIGVRMSARGEPDGDLTTWVCVTCGNELYSRGGAIGRLVCPRCGGVVFRPFDSPSREGRGRAGFSGVDRSTVSTRGRRPGTGPGDRRELDHP